MKKEIEAFVNAANEQELEAAWNNLSAEEQRVFEQLMEEEPPEDALAFFAQLYDDTPKEQASETVSISENEIYFKKCCPYRSKTVLHSAPEGLPHPAHAPAG